MVTQRLTIIFILLMLLLPLPQPAGAAPLQQPPEPSPCAIAVAAAVAQQGKPYVWGAKGPNAFDCSGLTQYAWLQAGINIGPSTYNQILAGVQIPCTLDDFDGPETTCWEPGDLIFLRYQGGQHVAMYIGNGLLADAYNQSLGVIVHVPNNDSFYQANFWQGRRIVDCDGVDVDIPSVIDPSPGGDDVSIEQLPDFLGYVTFEIPQCGICNADGSVLLAPTIWSESWPEGFELLNVARSIRITISWLAWQISEIIRQLICWLLSMLAIAAGVFALGVNFIIAGINGIFRVLTLLFLSGSAQFLAFWILLEEIRLSFSFAGLAGLAPFLALIADVTLLFVELIGRLISIFGSVALSIIGVVGWVGAYVLAFWGEFQNAISNTSAPDQLSATHVIYYATRGALEGIRDSAIGWVFFVLWGMAYVAFVLWLNKYFAASQQ